MFSSLFSCVARACASVVAGTKAVVDAVVCRPSRAVTCFIAGLPVISHVAGFVSRAFARRRIRLDDLRDIEKASLLAQSHDDDPDNKTPLRFVGDDNSYCDSPTLPPSELDATDNQFMPVPLNPSCSSATVRCSPDGNGRLLVQRADSQTWDEIDASPFLRHDGCEPAHQTRLGLSTPELDAVLHHLYLADGPRHGCARVRLHAADHAAVPAPTAFAAHAAPCTEPAGQPVYMASAVGFGKGGVHPCKVSPLLEATLCRVPWGGDEIPHFGEYDLLPFVPELMEFVDAAASEGEAAGTPPPGRQPVVGGYENGRWLYHAIAQVDGVWVPGKAGPQFPGAMVAYADRENMVSPCKILCWK
ncbi:hypothetical protein B0T24DRAFT_612623 [Lasiosphaeria ovina]|uniref:Uncharacterized protein n=1 Tax=Lasiosphaeria ovina TaxID=92902 RepID=A0AAE0NDU5_9PEZI|nr:hypothetical protein B0T24DRAFT_612623 [Lasiosphaeria ovina]